MQQMTWRAPDEVMQRVRAQAASRGRSLNDWVTAVLSAASDAAFADGEMAMLRERLARAGLLEPVEPRSIRRPPAAEVAKARAAAGRGRLLSDIVSDERG